MYGYRNSLNGYPSLDTCLFYGNTASSTGGEIANSSSSPTVTYSDIEGGYTGTGNINADPNFVDTAYYLSAGSPCVDAGTNSVVSTGDTDIDGDDRVIDGDEDETAVVDMGADEYDPQYYTE